MKVFKWRDLLRICKATYTDPVENKAELRDFLFILLFTCAAARRQISASRELLREDKDEMDATYVLVRESMTSLAQAGRLFPGARVAELLEFLESTLSEGMPGMIGTSKIEFAEAQSGKEN